MPIYEYMCPSCNRIYNFFAQSVNVERTPTCPKCGADDLVKQVSRFSFVRSKGSAGPKPEGGGEGDDPLDDPRIEREMMKLLSDVEGMDENDPRQLGRLMRRMSEITGEAMDEEMEEAVRRLESGEDPEKIEEEMGDLLGGDMMGGEGMPPTYDEGLYPM
jgi:putative FmdB family regulatory protein